MTYKCTECGAILKELNDYDEEGWFIDDGSGMSERSQSNKRLFHLCYECRSKNSDGYSKKEICDLCSRCWKITECGVSKWNLNHGHIHCCTCGNLCYDCHELLHYNK